jgi:hypothetical protein
VSVLVAGFEGVCERAVGRVTFHAVSVRSDNDDDEVDAKTAAAPLQRDSASGFDHRR